MTSSVKSACNVEARCKLAKSTCPKCTLHRRPEALPAETFTICTVATSAGLLRIGIVLAPDPSSHLPELGALLAEMPVVVLGTDASGARPSTCR